MILLTGILFKFHLTISRWSLFVSSYMCTGGVYLLFVIPDLV